MSTSLEIRPLRTADRAQWDELWAGYLSFYRHELADEITDATFARLCEQRDGMFALVAVAGDGALVGLTHATVHPTTWSTAGSCYLEDLFVAPAARGADAGRALIEATAAAARERGCDRLYWQTQQFNGRARSLYDTVGQLSSSVIYERELID
ncbi:GNAT family N-acetyltransferase [Conexibacter stalactiti]|uniref:GNAT family N-acetyltransferase n=1 Tax=Conexibacter stalactiti TaxID=1940611 RepID=A0ABU4HZA4_9ACTN|nr:GNAT family N-acetyltransferase [Conexibacter stalactiti]MDW5598560.1 GNAT family N-acetyltransferase [Conexibacter stalactiti]MEC5039202.1 GNAT family N-acetyltransferase [Conexibacter stalactiti]